MKPQVNLQSNHMYCHKVDCKREFCDHLQGVNTGKGTTLFFLGQGCNFGNSRISE